MFRIEKIEISRVKKGYAVRFNEGASITAKSISKIEKKIDSLLQSSDKEIQIIRNI